MSFKDGASPSLSQPDNCIVPQVGISVGSRVGVNVIKPNRSLSGAIRNPPLHTHSHMHDGTRGVEKECSDEQEQNTVQRGFHIALHYDHHGLITVT